MDLTTLAIPVFLALLALELVVARARGRDIQETRDTATSLALGVGSLIAARPGRPSRAGSDVTVSRASRSSISATARGRSSPRWSAVDFAYYWFHRLHHEVRVLWASHVPHHSSQRYNLSTALRQSWTPFTGAAVLPAARALVLAGADRDRLRHQPALPVLDPHRADRPARAARVGVQHAVAPSRPPRRERAVPRPQLRRHPDRVGPLVRHLRARARARALRAHQEHRDASTRCSPPSTSSWRCSATRSPRRRCATRSATCCARPGGSRPARAPRPPT